ncbi:uncharacterized protein K452DRAFT_305927 [Aplosporella prunicola CBS 121167]|uniref:Brl1/Brr6 domain-containing protein n=1 Tax=Aplosporella prunicola CBS 121167 TaxID=1176127 RepID=A0A6A6BQ91_9PEZI|nr:uncharacterized protein K452DRAFT_305927 [Aplosporella prunicola CBS 121167]KAF2144977.1 hypothetical protein K452DRAFT_305927 [Aplosporella prunicola CBS 121167]
MDRRSGHTPMDYEYSNGTGPVDETSPFITASRNAQSTAKKRTHNFLDTPSSKPQTPSLRPPASQPFYFSQTPSAFGAPPQRSPDKSHMKDPKFTTPRKFDLDFNSSGGETPDTPAVEADSEATPDNNMGIRRTINFMAGRSTSPTKSPKRRDSWFMSAVRGLGSPGKDRDGKELVKVREPYTDKAERRIIKRRERSRRTPGARRTRNSRDEDAEDSDEEGEKSTKDKVKQKAQEAKSSIVAAIFSYIETHPALPHILSYYAQLLLNFFVVFVIIYAVYTFWTAIKGDVDIESERAIAETLAEMAVCAQNYRENQCDPGTRMPALEVVCTNWEKCMSKDPKAVGRARVSAHTFAQIFNSFIEPISYKAMAFSLVIIFGCIAMSNFAFSIFRNKYAHDHPQQFPQNQQQQQQQYPPHFVPPTPQHRMPSGNWPEGGYWTPMHATPWQGGFPPSAAIMQSSGMEPAPSERGSPVKAVAFR